MDITPYVDNLRRDLVDAAGAGDESIQAAAERLALALAPAVRLALMEAVSQAADEITSEMRSGAVDVRLAGRQLEFVVTHEADLPAPPPPPAPPAPPEPPAEDDTLARVTLRLPETVKTRAEERAAESGQSLNSWLVDTIRAASHESAIRVDVDLSSIPLSAADLFGRGRGPRRMSGWV